MSRRARGEGSVHRTKDGAGWRGYVTLADGRRTWRRGKTRQAVVSRLARLRDEDEALERRSAHMTVEHYFDDWLESAKRTLEESTWTRYEELVRLYIVPAIGDVPLRTLRPQQIDALYRKALRVRSPATVRQIHAVVHRALHVAHRWGMIASNPAAMVDAPKVPRTEQATWSLEDARRFFAAIRDDPLEALYVVAITTGMRQGEILRLRWEYVDLERGSLSIPKAKNPTSRRFVALSGIAVAALWKLHEEGPLPWLGDLASPACKRRQQDSIIFPLTADQLRHRYWKLLAGASLPRIRFHDLRHTIATLLLQEGVPAKMVGEMLGHSSIVVTMDVYSHVTPGMHAEVASVIDGLFSPKLLPESL